MHLVRSMLLPICGALLISGVSRAEGRIEVNQAVVAAAGGFPFQITAPGSYVLTGDLVVETDTRAIEILAPGDVSIDLNGFRIAGVGTCAVGSCVPGTAGGIFTIGPARRSRVFGGTITGFSANCVDLGDEAHVHDLTVFQCGLDGISVGERSRVMNNIVLQVGIHGIVVGEGSIHGHNTVSVVDLFQVGGRGIDGGVATVGNYCDDASCSGSPTRRYFLTQNTFAANQVLTACPVGFHTASLWEIFHTSALRYDTERGYARQDQPFPDDSGSGPPGFPGISGSTWGWIRTGASSSSVQNCLVWTSTSEAEQGLTVSLGDDWDSTFQLQRIAPWYSNQIACNNARRVWCVQN